jgi:hypothetical protein
MKKGWDERSAHRLAYAVAVLMFLMIPIHYIETCRVSSLVFGLNMGLLIVNGLFSWADHSGKRLQPFAAGLVAFIAHMVSTH